MEPMSPDEKLFVQNLEKSVQELGFSRAEVLVNLVFLTLRQVVRGDFAPGSHLSAVKHIVPDNLRSEGLIPFTQQLEGWSRDGTLTEHIARKPPKHDRAKADLEGDLHKHIMCSEAAVWAFEGGKVHTEQDFLEKDLSDVLPPRVWDKVQQARKWWRKTTMIQNLDAVGRLCLILVYRCDIWRPSAQDTKAAVSQNTDRHMQPRSQNTDTRSRGLKTQTYADTRSKHRHTQPCARTALERSAI